jgi:hypothetical protein
MKKIAVLLIIGMALVGMAGAANYMYETATVKGVGYKNVEVIIQTQMGLAGNKLTEKESGSGNVILEKTEIEANRDYLERDSDDENCDCSDYINFTKEADFEYMPVSYQTGNYDQKWIEKLCVQNYYIGAVVVEMYTHAESLQKTTMVKTRRQCNDSDNSDECGTCRGTLEAHFSSEVIGVAHIGWLSKDPVANDKGRHDEYGRSIEDLTGVFNIDKTIQLWGNDSCEGPVQIDWLPCI